MSNVINILLVTYKHIRHKNYVYKYAIKKYLIWKMPQSTSFYEKQDGLHC